MTEIYVGIYDRTNNMLRFTMQLPVFQNIFHSMPDDFYAAGVNYDIVKNLPKIAKEQVNEYGHRFWELYNA